MIEENQSNDDQMQGNPAEVTSGTKQPPKTTVKSFKSKKDSQRHSGEGRLKMKLPWQASKDTIDDMSSVTEELPVDEVSVPAAVEPVPREVVSLDDKTSEIETIQPAFKKESEPPVSQEKSEQQKPAAEPLVSQEKSEQQKPAAESPVSQEKSEQQKPATKHAVIQVDTDVQEKSVQLESTPDLITSEQIIEKDDEQPMEQAVQQEIQLESVTSEQAPVQVKKSRSTSVSVEKKEKVNQNQIIKQAEVKTEESIQNQTNSSKVSRSSKFPWLTLVSGIVVGCLLGGAIGAISAYKWYDANNTFRKQYNDYKITADKTISEQKEQLDKMEKELENHQFQLNNVSLGYSQISKILERSDVPPAKPRYKEIGNGILLYWIDDVLWRRYFVYQARGKKGKFNRKFRKAQKKNFIYLPKLKKGTYRFTISALDREGKETEKSDQVTVIIRK